MRIRKNHVSPGVYTKTTNINIIGENNKYDKGIARSESMGASAAGTSGGNIGWVFGMRLPAILS